MNTDKIKELMAAVNNGKFDGAAKRLSEKIGVSEAAVSRWLKGDRKPSEDGIRAFADAVNIPLKEAKQLFGIADLEFADRVRAVPLTDKNTISLPILAEVPAGLPEFSDADVETFWDIPRWVFPGADFVVKCNGDSLEPKLHAGDYCVIRKTTEPLHGRAMMVKTENGICMKVINKRGDGLIELRSTNPKYLPFVPQELAVVGLIIGHWSRDDKENWNGLTE